jgi:putative methanogen marker protein 4
MTIGIGASEDIEKIVTSIRRVSSHVQVACYCGPETQLPEDIHYVQSESPECALVADLMAGRIQGAVRGNLPSNTTLRALKQATGVDHLLRIALLETADGRLFLLAPVGVDEGWTIPEKLDMVVKGREIARKFGLPQGVAILSGGRLGDVGRHKQVDKSLASGELVAKLTSAWHAEILIEDAVEECGLIIAPDGISGNLIFRTLTFLGAGKGHGAPVVNIDITFVDTSRASPDYTNALLLADALSKT